METIPVIIVLGATASGKTALSVALAQALDGEIINGDSMAVYRHMDIGTAKPSPEEQGGIPHHLLSCFEPEESCQVSRWLKLADAAAADIHQRGKIAILCGGSPLYTKAFLEGLSAGTPRDEAMREQLEAEYDERGGEALLQELTAIDPDYAKDRHANDKRRIVRALEVYRLSGKPFSSFHVTDGIRRDCYRTCIIGLEWDKETLHKRINKRAKLMLENGLIEEVKSIGGRLSDEARQAVGYKEVIAHLAGEYNRDHALYQIKRNSRRLAKHQLTWYKRWTDIHWLPGDAEGLPEQAIQIARSIMHNAP